MKKSLWILAIVFCLLADVCEASSGPPMTEAQFWLSLTVLPVCCIIELIVLLVWRAFFAVFWTVFFLGFLLFALASLGDALIAFFFWPWIAVICISIVLNAQWWKRKKRRAIENT